MEQSQDPTASARARNRVAPAARHLVLLAVTYVALAFAIATIQRLLPPVEVTPGGVLSLQAIARAAGAMLAALALALPLTWVFLLTRRRKGFSQSVVHTLLVLPLAVAGIMTLVQDSLPLAFGLAGLAFLRFRNTLRDTKDAVYLVVATGIGISAASGQLAVGYALSFLFSATVVVLWWTDFARTPTRVKAALMLRRLRDSVEWRVAGAPSRPRDLVHTGLRVYTSNVAAAQPLVEALLRDSARRWELTGITPAENGVSRLDYAVRLRQRIERGGLLNDLRIRGAPHIVGAEYR
jgi:hypothetical protein